MANVTLSIPNDLLKAGRAYAQRQHMSLNALIRDLLGKTVKKTANKTWLKECFKLMDRAKVNSHGQKWQREDLYRV